MRKSKAAEEVVDTWETRKGLPDDFEGTIANALFDTREEYMDGTAPLLILELDSDVGPMEIRYSIGKPGRNEEWQIVDRGGAVDSDVDGARFSEQSMYGRLINKCVQELGMRDTLTGRGNALEAGVWIGLRFHWIRETFEFGGEIGSRDHLMPDAYLGEAKTTRKTKAKAKAAPVEDADEEEDEEESEDPLEDCTKAQKAKVKKLAKVAADWVDFQVATIDVDWPQALTDVIVDDVACEELYDELVG